MKDIRLTDHFMLHEFACRCNFLTGNCGGAVVVPPETFLVELELVRVTFGIILINRGFSCKDHNANIGGAPQSYHTMCYDRFALYGAGDIQAVELKDQFGMEWIDLVYDFAETSTHFNGIIAHRRHEDVDKSFIHLDCRPTRYMKVEEW